MSQRPLDVEPGIHRGRKLTPGTPRMVCLLDTARENKDELREMRRMIEGRREVLRRIDGAKDLVTVIDEIVLVERQKRNGREPLLRETTEKAHSREPVRDATLPRAPRTRDALSQFDEASSRD